MSISFRDVPDIRPYVSYAVSGRTGYHYPIGGLNRHCRYTVKLMVVHILILRLVCVNVVTPVQLEMDQFFREPTINRNDDPVIWWQQIYHRFPLQAAVARRFLAASPSSVASEGLFSTAGDVLTDSSSCLLPERAVLLIFLKINLPVLN
jgi:hypothetical protein